MTAADAERLARDSYQALVTGSGFGGAVAAPGTRGRRGGRRPRPRPRTGPRARTVDDDLPFTGADGAALVVRGPKDVRRRPGTGPGRATTRMPVVVAPAEGGPAAPGPGG